MRRIGMCTMFFWMGATFAYAQTRPSSTPTTAPVNQLIKQLSADEWRTRQTAQKELVELGQAAVEALRATTQQAIDDETRSRVDSSLAEIADNQVSGPSFITLHLQDQPPGVVFEELSKQCGVSLEPITPELWQQRSIAPITIDVDRQPFWVVMHELTVKTGVVLQPWENTQKLTTTVGATHGPQVVSGAFQITADNIRRSQMINLATGTMPSDEFGITLSFTPEPKLRLGRIWNGVSLTAAVDDHGNSLIAPELPNRGMGGFINGPMGSWPIQVPLRYPRNNAGTKLAHLAGSIRAEIKTQIQTVQFDDVLTSQNVRKTLHGHAITLVNAEKQAADYVLHLAGDPRSFGGGEANEDDWSPQNFSMETPDGRALRLSNFSQSITNNRRELELHFSSAGVPNLRLRPGQRVQDSIPARLKWSVAAASKQVDVPFSFSDLPMP